MALFNLTSKQQLVAIIVISTVFFIVEIAIAFYTGSLALLAEAFHYLNDLIAYAVALAAIMVPERAKPPLNFSFGWARAQLLGAFFNGVFLLALGLSVFLQSIERFVSIQPIENPKLVLIIGSVGLALNLISATLLHGHHHHHHHHGGQNHGQTGQQRGPSHGPVNIEAAVPSRQGSSENIPLTPIGAHADHRHTLLQLQAPGRDLGTKGVYLHVLADALNNVAVIISALIIWLTSSPARFYADPGISTAISIFIIISAIPITKNSGKILMQNSVVNVADVKHDMEKIFGSESVHELHIWQLDQEKSIASAHVVVSNNEMSDFMDQAKTVSECLHDYGIHSATLQPELVTQVRTAAPSSSSYGEGSSRSGLAARSSAGPGSRSALRRRRTDGSGCQIVCGNICESLTCCSTTGALRM